MIRIGIDTGGTYTDAVAVDMDSGSVLFKGKSPTTNEDLCIGIKNALSCIPAEMLKRAEVIALSTTLSTNACVENKGGRAKLILLGTSMEILRRIDAAGKFGLSYDSVLCIETGSSFDGRIVDEPDWEAVLGENTEWFADAEALSIADVYAVHNGAVSERNAKQFFAKHLDIPIIAGSELVSGLNVMERGATALLNARLLPIIYEFVIAIENAIRDEDVLGRSFNVRSDGSLMSHSLLLKRPVETILSGPATSVLGGYRLSGNKNCLIIDMGGTTTDISIVKNGLPKLAENGIKVGGWSTQVSGVFVDTFALGGDSAIRIEHEALTLNNRRVVPLCHGASRWPEIKETLRARLVDDRRYCRDFHEFLYLAKVPRDMSLHTQEEALLIKALENGPRMIETFSIEEDGVDKYRLNCRRLEDEGIVMRCGLTPTDIMHIRGDYLQYDREASELAAQFFLRTMVSMGLLKGSASVETFAELAYDLVCKKLCENIIRVLLNDRFPYEFKSGLDSQIGKLISAGWDKDGIVDIIEPGFSTSLSLVGVGAPIHVFLPRVARQLNTRCIIPEHAEVANAVGAALADITVRKTITLRKNIFEDETEGYAVHSQDSVIKFAELEDAQEAALKKAEAEAVSEARLRGALGELHIESFLSSGGKRSKIFEGMFATAVVTGRLTDTDS